MDYTTIAISLITAISAIITGVFVGSRKRKADGTNRHLENVEKAIDIWQKNAEEMANRYELLQKQLMQKNEELTKAIYQLKDAIYYAKKCDYAVDCPVLNKLGKLQNTPIGDN